MTAPNYGVDALAKAARAAAEAFLAALDEATGVVPATSRAGDPASVALIEYDPLNDEPPFTPNPSKSASEAQQHLASITHLGAIGRINAEGRGATSKEISKFAKKAGYSSGNAVNGWNSQAKSPRAIELVDGARFLNDDAFTSIKEESAKLGIKHVGEFKTVPMPS